MPLKTLEQHLNMHPGNRYIIGFSGGRDSHVLLDMLWQLRQAGQLSSPIIAIHVNHRLQKQSNNWAKHCQEVCQQYGVELISEVVTADPKVGESLEAFAREARYALINKHLTDGDVFLSAHHQRDQAETLLLQLMRGAGLDGLQAMPVIKPFGAGQYLRPLLNVGYEDIVAYAEEKQLNFITDDSNNDTRFNRNYVRHEVLPVLKQRFPQAEQAIARSATWLREVPTPTPPDKLYLPALSRLSAGEQKRQIRDYCKAKIGQPLSKTQTDYILSHHLRAAADKQPQLKVGQYVVRRFRDELLVTADLPQNADGGNGNLLNSLAEVEVGKTYRADDWATLTWQVGQGGLIVGKYQLKPLSGSRRFHPHTRAHSTTVKKLLPESGVPPWLRPLLPGLYQDGELVAIPGIGVARARYRKNANAMLPLWLIEQKFVKL